MLSGKKEKVRNEMGIDRDKMRRNKRLSDRREKNGRRDHRDSKPKREWTTDDIIGYNGDGDPATASFLYEGIEHVTEKGALLIVDGDKAWVPKSQIIDADGDRVIVTKWWAEKQSEIVCDW
jgi:hypothetical protein